MAKTKTKPRPTIKQRRLARLVTDSARGRIKPSTERELMLMAGYSESAANVPGNIINAPGTVQALKDEGFTPERAKDVVQMIMNSEDAEDRDRLKAADMVFKVTGEYASDKIAAKNNANPVIFAKIEQHVTVFEAKLKEALGYVLEEKSE